MLIDWFTVGAQILNFLLLVYLLKRFLWGPIVRHMDERQEIVKSRLRSARERQKEAEDEIADYRRRQEKLEEERRDTLARAEQEADQRRQDLLGKAKREIEEHRRRWESALGQEREAFCRELKKRSCREVLNVVRSALRDLADEELTHRLAEVLLTRTRQLEKEELDTFRRAAGNQDLIVRSTCELDEPQKRRITARLHEICGTETVVSFATDPALPLGIEVRADSARLSWGIGTYLDALRERVLEHFETPAGGRNESDSGSGDKSSGGPA